jgi:hypothetical protein
MALNMADICPLGTDNLVGFNTPGVEDTDDYTARQSAIFPNVFSQHHEGKESSLFWAGLALGEKTQYSLFLFLVHFISCLSSCVSS